MIYEYGPPEVMRFEERAEPLPGSGQVLVRLFATSVNPFDIYRRSGAVKEQAPILFPGIVGVDVAGIVQALGEGVEDFSVGDKVFGMGDQAYAELCAVPASSLIRIPEQLDVFDAAAIPLVTTTGNQLAQAAGARAGQTVLVTGAAGNVGRSAVYTLKAQGAIVIAGVLAKQLSSATDLGSDKIVAIDDAEVTAQLPLLDAVADTVSGKTAELLIAKVKPGGTFATVLDVPKNASAFPEVKCVPVLATPSATTLAKMAEAIVSGKLTIPVGERFPLAEAAQAHAAIAAGTVHGKALLIADAEGLATAMATSEIKVLIAAYNAALNGSDTETVLSLYTQGGIFMAPFSNSAIGAAAIRTAYDNVFVTRKFDVVFYIAELVVLTPTSAYARTSSAGHTTNPTSGRQASEGNQELFLFRKDAAGVWKISRYSFSPTGASPA